MSTMMVMPSQYALKLPATKPERIVSDAPPSLLELTISRTCLDPVDVKTLTSSGMIAPARVPHVTIVESCHQSLPSLMSPSSAYDAMYVSTTDTIEVSHTSRVSGCS